VFVLLFAICGQARPQAAAQTTADQPSSYHLVRTVPLPFLKNVSGMFIFEPVTRRFFVSDGKDLIVLDDTESKIGSIPKIGRVTDLAVAPEMNQAFIVDGVDNDFIVVDLQRLMVLEKVHAGTSLSIVLYDPSTKEIVLASGHNKDCVVVDATTLKVIKTVKLGGYAYAGVTDGKGHAYFELGRDEFVDPLVSGPELYISRAPPANAAALAELDEHSLTINNSWKEPCKPIRLLGVDGGRQRLIAACGRSVASIDEETGKIVAVSSIGQTPAWFVNFDSELGDAFADVAHTRPFGLTLMVLHENSAGEFVDPKMIDWGPGRRLGLDGKKGQIFVLSSDQKMTDTGLGLAPPNADGVVPLRVPTSVPGTFRISVYAKN
jgi:hypothetical protein